MKPSHVLGTEGYAESAAALIDRWEKISFHERHGSVSHLFPATASRILDIGSGSGADAASFAAQGHRVVAVEPCYEMRAAAAALHPSGAIEWLDDSLPDLGSVLARHQCFNLVMSTAVWMHLDRDERRRAMPALAATLCVGGLAIIALRHGPVRVGRRMFDVSATETIELALASDLTPILSIREPSFQDANRANGVSWSRVAFKKRSPAE